MVCNRVGFSVWKAGDHFQTPSIHRREPKKFQEVNEMKKSIYQSYDDLPLFLNAELIAKVLGVAPSSAYELMHEKGFPVIRVGNRLIVPKEKFREWVDSHFPK